MRKVAICKISVEKLFGLYNYEIPPKNKKQDISSVLILYGDNGSGKTTILRLIFHLLGYERSAGHKSYVANTKFSTITIEFTNGYEIKAFRRNSSIIGSFEMQFLKEGKIIGETTYIADSSNTVKPGGELEESHNKFLHLVSTTLNMSIYLLSDDRRVQITSPDEYLPNELRRPFSAWRSNKEYNPRLPKVVFSDDSDRDFLNIDFEQLTIMLLDNSIDRATFWIRQQAMHGSTRGESDVNTIYSDIMRQIASTKKDINAKEKLTREGLLEKIDSIENRNNQYSKFGFTPNFDGRKLIDSINKASPRQISTIRSLLVPYLNSFEAKLDALRNIQNWTDTLVNNLNSFLTDKNVSFNVQRGFIIKSRNNEQLSSRMLSSGEKHLFLLFCNATTSHDRQSIFIIDEPEISLNVKWQRLLISALLDCMKKSPVQYIFATHSFEILSQHTEQIVKLECQSG